MDRRSSCPIANSLDILGDKWTLLVLRDLLDGKTRFSEFEASPEGIPTNILTDRLRRLESAGILERRQKDGSTRSTYHPTDSRRAPLGRPSSSCRHGPIEHLEDTWVPPPDYLTATE